MQHLQVWQETAPKTSCRVHLIRTLRVQRVLTAFANLASRMEASRVLHLIRSGSPIRPVHSLDTWRKRQLDLRLVVLCCDTDTDDGLGFFVSSRCNRREILIDAAARISHLQVIARLLQILVGRLHKLAKISLNCIARILAFESLRMLN